MPWKTDCALEAFPMPLIPILWVEMLLVNVLQYHEDDLHPLQPESAAHLLPPEKQFSLLGRHPFHR